MSIMTMQRRFILSAKFFHEFFTAKVYDPLRRYNTPTPKKCNSQEYLGEFHGKYFISLAKILFQLEYNKLMIL